MSKQAIPTPLIIPVDRFLIWSLLNQTETVFIFGHRSIKIPSFTMRFHFHFMNRPELKMKNNHVKYTQDEASIFCHALSPYTTRLKLWNKGNRKPRQLSAHLIVLLLLAIHNPKRQGDSSFLQISRGPKFHVHFSPLSVFPIDLTLIKYICKCTFQVHHLRYWRPAWKVKVRLQEFEN